MPLPLPEESSTSPMSQTEIFKNREIIKNTNVNRTVYSTKDYSEISRKVLAYIEGHKLTCVYYTSLASEGLQRSSATDTTSTRDNVTIPLRKISSFEMKTSESFSPNYDPENNETNITGSAVTYPGFEPGRGDFFLYGVGSGHVGIFRIDSVEPMSYFKERLYRITFYMSEILTSKRQKDIDDKVKEEVTFSLETLLSKRPVLLTSKNYNILDEFARYRRTIIRTFYDNYYKNFIGSMLDDKGIYDPYITSFIRKITDYKDTGRIPLQLYPKIENDFSKTFLFKLLKREEASFLNILKYARLSHSIKNFRDIHITPLINRSFYVLEKREDGRYLSLNDFMGDTNYVSLENGKLKTINDPQINTFIYTKNPVVADDFELTFKILEGDMEIVIFPVSKSIDVFKSQVNNNDIINYTDTATFYFDSTNDRMHVKVVNEPVIKIASAYNVSGVMDNVDIEKNMYLCSITRKNNVLTCSIGNHNVFKEYILGTMIGDVNIGIVKHRDNPRLDNLYLNKESFNIPTYIFSQAFYSEDTDKMSDMEKLVYHAIKHDVIEDKDMFFENHVKTYENEDFVHFYKHPLLARLLDMAMRDIRLGR